MIKTHQLHSMRPLLEGILSKVQGVSPGALPTPADFVPLPVLP